MFSYGRECLLCNFAVTDPQFSVADGRLGLYSGEPDRPSVKLCRPIIMTGVYGLTVGSIFKQLCTGLEYWMLLVVDWKMESSGFLLQYACVLVPIQFIHLLFFTFVWRFMCMSILSLML